MWNEEDWAFARTKGHRGELMSMDPLHVRAIYDFVLEAEPEKILEVGCWDGYSTSALVTAMNDGLDCDLVCCDIDIRDGLIRVLRHCTSPWGAYQGRSVDAFDLFSHPDLVILDGAHDKETLWLEYNMINQQKIETVIAHDVGYDSGQEGPFFLREQLLKDGGWVIYVDDSPRPGMMTQRGLMIATKNTEWAEIADNIFAALARASHP
jgi:hypothetical protein